MTYDVVVVGAGLAGLASALAVAQSGARVAVVAAGVGSLHLGGATIDVLGYAPSRVDEPDAALPSFVRARPDHPYARIGVDAISASTRWLSAQTALGPFVGGTGHNLLLPTAVGALKPSAVVPESMAAGDQRDPGNVLVAGFRLLKDFYPGYLADNLVAAGISARAVTLEVALPPPLDNEADVGPLGFARCFDDVEFLKGVARALEEHLEPNDALGLPAVLGRMPASSAWRDLAELLGRPVFEIPTLPPSVPGIRLYEAMTAAIRSAGGRIVLGSRIVAGSGSGRRLEAVAADTGARETTYRAEAFVLASGGVIGGGIAMDSHWSVTETALGLFVAGVPESDGGRFNPEYFGSHPMGAAGVAIDERGRPVDERGEVVYENLFAAGATLGRAEPWREKSGNGISLATGWHAADMITKGRMSWS